MLDLSHILKSRLLNLEHVASKGVIPGELDSYELEQLIGRIKELKHVITLIRINCHHDWQVLPPDIKVEPQELTYNPPKLKILCALCGAEN